MVRGCFGFRVEDSGLQRSMVCVFVGSGVGFALDSACSQRATVLLSELMVDGCFGR